MSRPFKIAVIVFAVFLLLMCLGPIWPFELVFYLLTGWGLFLVHVVPQVTVDPVALGSGVVALVLFAAGAHLFMRRFHREVEASRAEALPIDDAPMVTTRTWPLRWTFLSVSVVIVTFVAGICMVGVVHQFAWLATSQDPIFQYRGVRERARRSGSANNLKQIGLAASKAGAEGGTILPGTIVDDDGHLLHGWMTQLLPFVEHGHLYEKIDLKKAWNDPSNAETIQEVIPTLLNPGDDGMSVENGFGMTHYAGNPYVVGSDHGLSRDGLRDGAAETVLAGEAAGDHRPWSYPANSRDPRLGLNRSKEGFGGPWKNRETVFVFADGSTRTISRDVDSAVLQALFTPAGGEAVPEDFDD